MVWVLKRFILIPLVVVVVLQSSCSWMESTNVVVFVNGKKPSSSSSRSVSSGGRSSSSSRTTSGAKKTKNANKVSTATASSSSATKRKRMTIEQDEDEDEDDDDADDQWSEEDEDDDDEEQQGEDDMFLDNDDDDDEEEEEELPRRKKSTSRRPSSRTARDTAIHRSSSKSSSSRKRSRYIVEEDDDDEYHDGEYGRRRSTTTRPRSSSSSTTPRRSTSSTRRSSSSIRKDIGRGSPRPNAAAAPGGRRPPRPTGGMAPYGGRGQYRRPKPSTAQNAAAALTQGWATIKKSMPDPTTVRDAAMTALDTAKETTSSLSTNLYREVKGLTSSELEQVMLKATKPDDSPAKGKHVERLVGVTYQIKAKYDIYDAVLRKLWSKMAEKDWRTTIKALYILHRFSADGAPEHAPSLKARLRELRRTHDPKRKDKYFNSKQLLAGDSKPENIKFRAFMSRYAHYVLLRAQCFSGLFDEISSVPKADKKKPPKPITQTSLRAEHLEASGILLKSGIACQLKDGEECEHCAVAAERVASDMIGLTTAVAIALNRALNNDDDDDDLRGADPVLIKKWCILYSEELLPKTRAMVKKTSPKLDAYGLYLPSRMGTSVAPDVLEKGLKLEEKAATKPSNADDATVAEGGAEGGAEGDVTSKVEKAPASSVDTDQEAGKEEEETRTKATTPSSASTEERRTATKAVDQEEEDDEEEEEEDDEEEYEYEEDEEEEDEDEEDEEDEYFDDEEEDDE